MERFEKPLHGNMDDAILIVVSGGLCDFVRNTIASIARAGETNSTLCIALPRNALEDVQAAVAGHAGIKYFLLDDVCRPEHPWSRQYHDFGSAEFARFTVAKWPAIRFLLKQGFRRVTYTDVDLAWIRNPMPFLRSVLQQYEVAIQTDGTEDFPPNYCTGFMSYRNTEFTIQLLEFLEKAHLNILRDHPAVHDQTAFNRVVAGSTGVIFRIFPLSELLFANGQLTGAIVSQDDELAKIVVRKISPFIFHANWAVGTENKRRLLQRTKNWLIEST